MTVNDLTRRLRQVMDTKHLDSESRATIQAAVEELEHHRHSNKKTKVAQAVRRILWWLLLEGLAVDE